MRLAHLFAGARQGARERSQVAHEQIGLLHGGEVTAAVELGPLHDVGEASAGEAPNGQENVVRKTATPSGTVSGGGGGGTAAVGSSSAVSTYSCAEDPAVAVSQ
jgi:hypothetical protein